MSCRLDDPTGYGRILRDAQGRVIAIREHRDATHEERCVVEVNAGIYFAEAQALREALAALRCDNDQKEFYLTDVVAILGRTASVEARLGSPDTLLGINDRDQLEAAEQRMLARIRTRHRRNGVTIRGDARIEDGVELAPDCVIESGVQLRGTTRIGSGTHVDVGSVLSNATVGCNTAIRPYTVVTDSEVGDSAQLGPFAHLRPASVIEDEAHVGNFVETKKTRVRRGAKANHLAYLGDGDVGERANIGAGTIFCNYDGYRKHPTTIGAGAFIGSDSQLVAPVAVGKGAYIATGTTVTTDVPDDALAIGRVIQENKLGLAARLRRRLAAAAGKKP
jgi:bifunctional UDP-N-acetylglucosamine pyrophosphorylase/glucosamine-1-phosphate N-acetyltransferase